jgi:hypothetical protein
MEVLIQELNSLLLLERAEPYLSSWNKLKARVAKLTAGRQINIDNQYIVKLILAAEALVNNQKKPVSAVSALYTAILRNMPAWTDLLSVCKILARLTRKLIIIYSNTFLQDQRHPV